jgi:hypothetical protein
MCFEFEDRIQGDISGWINGSDPLNDTKTYNQTGLVRVLPVLLRLESNFAVSMEK